MQQIIPPISLAKKILGEQRINKGTHYRLSTHCVQLNQPEGVLFYHTLTGELLLLSCEEDCTNELIHRWFLTPEETDDIALADRIFNIARIYEPKNKILTEYLIFTTTACNARCFYCFEAGIKTAVMTEKTAQATGEYIAKHCGGNPVRLVWFGGEPLVNFKAIDIISESLRKNGVSFSSRMDSNGSLFTEELVKRAKNDWKLDEVQITLDGTEKIYNERKAYVNPNGNPFKLVLHNINLLLDAGVPVTVRLNMDEENEQDLYNLIDNVLVKKFANMPGFSIHLRAIIENRGYKPSNYTEKKRISLVKKLNDLWNYLDEQGLSVRRPLKQSLVLYSCWSDKKNATTITPDGHLGRCESHIDKGLWGNVFNDEENEEVLRQWKERCLPKKRCYTCELYPQCVRLKECVNHSEDCSLIEQEEQRIRMKRSILKTFEEWKDAHNSNI